MITLIFTVFLGAYAAQRISIVRDGEIASISVDYLQIWNDAIAFLELIGNLSKGAIGFGRVTRNYFDNAIAPWLSKSFGIALTIPTLNLPALPTPQK